MLDITTLANWLWEAACKIRGEIDAPKYKDYILPLIFLKRLSDVFDDEMAKLAGDYGDPDVAKELVEDDHTLVWFYIPPDARWEAIVKQSVNRGQFLTDAVRAIARQNPKLQGVIDIKDFNETAAGQRVISEEKLKDLINVLNRHRLGMQDVEPDILGRAYEYLLRKFAEGSGQSAGEFYTPKEVAILMARMVNQEPGETVYDPCAGSGGLLIKTYLRFKERYGSNPQTKPLQFSGQEILHSTYAIARMNTFIHRMEAQIALGDTMNRPAFLTPAGALQTFNIVVANPMWNQDFSQSTYENDTYNRFGLGYPPSSSADWGWIQHMFASLNERGRLAVVLDTGTVSRGSGNTGANRERDIRKQFVEQDWVEGVILLPENLFYNTSAPGVILLMNKTKAHQQETILINAAQLFEKGRPKNFLPDAQIERITDLYLHWQAEEGVSTIVTQAELAKNDYNLSPSRYVAQNGGEEVLPLEDAFVLVQEAEEERQQATTKLQTILAQIGLE
jgi:type I restriction enzyme M protein